MFDFTLYIFLIAIRLLVTYYYSCITIGWRNIQTKLKMIDIIFFLHDILHDTEIFVLLFHKTSRLLFIIYIYM